MKCVAACLRCRGSGVVQYTATERRGKTVVKTFTYEAECPRPEGAQRFLERAEAPKRP